MKILAIISLTIATIVAKPSGIIHSQPLVYSSPLQPAIVSEDLGAIHHEIYPGAVVASPHAVVHKTVVSDVPSIQSVSHQHSSLVHHYDTPTVVHKSIVQPAFHTLVHEAPAVIQHEAFVAKALPAVVQQPSIIEQEALISGPNALVVEPKLSTVAHVPVLSDRASVSGVISPVVHHHALVAPAVLKKTIASESVGVKHTVSSQASSIVHPSTAIHQHYEIPIVQNAILQSAVPIPTHYSFGYLSGLPTEVKTVEKTEIVEDKPSVSISSESAAETPVESVDLSNEKLEKLSTKIAFDSNIKSGAIQDVSSSAALLPSGYSYAYLAQQPIVKTAYVHQEPILSHVQAVVPGVTLTAGGVPFDTPEVIQAKAAHFAAFRGLQAKDEKPCD